MKISQIDSEKIISDFQKNKLSEYSLDIVDRLIFSYDVNNKGQYDYILTLGCPTCMKHRAVKACELFIDGHGKKLLFSGGVQIPNTNLTESEGMQLIATKNRISKNSIILENESRFTHENIMFSAKLMNRFSAAKPYSVLLVTSPYHMRRALLNLTHYRKMFPKLSFWDACPCDSHSVSRNNWYKNEKGMKIINREFTALCEYVERGYLPDIDFD